LIQTLTGHTGEIRDLKQIRVKTRSNDYIVSGSDDSSIKIWDTNNQEYKLVYTFDQSNGGHSSPIITLASLKSGYLGSGAWDCNLKIWDLNQLKLVYTFSIV
jgi:WD40 repeat protein